MARSLPLTLFLTGCGLSLLFIILEVRFKANLFHSSVNMQKHITKTPPHGLHYFMKIFEWLILVLTWVTLMTTLYFEFNKLTSWKLVISVWVLSFVVDFVKLLFAGSRPIFQNSHLSHNGCECSFGTPSWYAGFLIVFWVLFYNDVIKNREVFKVS
jgi:hypothetical protein